MYIGSSGEGSLQERDLFDDLCRWVCNFKIYLKQTHLAQVRENVAAFVNMVLNIRVPQNEGHFLTSRETVRFPRWALLHGVSQEIPHL
jgi:hypothetical protein